MSEFKYRSVPWQTIIAPAPPPAPQQRVINNDESFPLPAHRTMDILAATSISISGRWRLRQAPSLSCASRPGVVGSSVILFFGGNKEQIAWNGVKKEPSAPIKLKLWAQGTAQSTRRKWAGRTASHAARTYSRGGSAVLGLFRNGAAGRQLLRRGWRASLEIRFHPPLTSLYSRPQAAGRARP